MTPKASFDAWALVELMGHQRIVGRVTEETIGGASMLRVDVPDSQGETAYTRFYSAAAVYSISPVDKQIAIGMAANIDTKPVSVYDLVHFAKDKQLGWPAEVQPDDDEEALT